MILAILVLISALGLSFTAAYFSVVGLMSIFSASATSVAVLGLALEAAKIISATWLHKNFRNPNVSILIKGYMSIAILVLMLITSIGIFGFLSAGHLNAIAPTQKIQLEISAIDQKIASDQKTIDRDNQQLSELDKSLDVYLKNDRASQALKARANQKEERAMLNKEIADEQKDIDSLQSQEDPLKQQLADTSQKLGPLKYIADVLYSDGSANMDRAVQLLILIIMVAFDPMAIVMIIGSSISLGEYFDKKKAVQKPATISPISAPTIKDEIKPGQTTLPVITPEVKTDPSYLEKKFKAMYEKYIPNKPKE